ncbi:MAG: hypothetical protein DIU80_017590 [Chloroflexota bacterium]
MYGPKNKRSALAALVAAGGLWAWQNRDKIRSWLNSQRSQLEANRSFSDEPRSFTGETRRIGEHYPGVDAADQPGDRPAPKSYDAQI